MPTPYLEIVFRHGRLIAAYLHCALPQFAAVTRQISPGLILDLDDHGTVLGLEITDPTHADIATIPGLLQPYGITLNAADLAPLAA